MNRRRLRVAAGREEHLGRHNVTLAEAKQVFESNARVRRVGLGRYTLVGQTDSGRYLVVVVAPREDGIYGLVTAREAEAHERRAYLRWQR